MICCKNIIHVASLYIYCYFYLFMQFGNVQMLLSMCFVAIHWFWLGLFRLDWSLTTPASRKTEGPVSRWWVSIFKKQHRQVEWWVCFSKTQATQTHIYKSSQILQKKLDSARS